MVKPAVPLVPEVPVTPVVPVVPDVPWGPPCDCCFVPQALASTSPAPIAASAFPLVTMHAPPARWASAHVANGAPGVRAAGGAASSEPPRRTRGRHVPRVGGRAAGSAAHRAHAGP